MPRGISVLRHPERYSKKRVERALNRQASRKKTSTIEKLFAEVEADAVKASKPNGAAIKAHCRSILHFDTDNTYRINGLKVDMFDPDNAAEIVRRFNSGDA